MLGCEFFNFSQIPGSVSYSRFLILKNCMYHVHHTCIAVHVHLLLYPCTMKEKFNIVFGFRDACLTLVQQLTVKLQSLVYK